MPQIRRPALALFALGSSLALAACSTGSTTVPVACLGAIDEGRELIVVIQRTAEAGEDQSRLIADAMVAGNSNDATALELLTDRVKQETSQIKAIARQARAHREAFEDHASRCEAES